MINNKIITDEEKCKRIREMFVLSIYRGGSRTICETGRYSFLLKPNRKYFKELVNDPDFCDNFYKCIYIDFHLKTIHWTAEDIRLVDNPNKTGTIPWQNLIDSYDNIYEWFKSLIRSDIRSKMTEEIKRVTERRTNKEIKKLFDLKYT